MNEDLAKLPKNLPIPKDDGKANHLDGMMIPWKILQQIFGDLGDVKINNKKFLILCFFPMISIVGKKLPPEWNNIPGARGCTPQNIEISKRAKNFEEYNSIIIGISTQKKDELTKISFERKFSHLLVSDTELKFKREFNIPVFEVENKTMYKRITLIIKESKIVKTFYPIFPPDTHASKLINWLEENSKIS